MYRVQFNADQVFQRLTTVRSRLEDMTPLYNEIGEHMVNSTKERFHLGEAPDGTRWQPKKQATIDRYKAKGDGNRPDPLIGPSKSLSTQILTFVSRSGVEIGSNLEYAGVMQDGARKGAFGVDKAGRLLPWGDIPARVWLGLSADDERTILDICDEYMGAALDE